SFIGPIRARRPKILAELRQTAPADIRKAVTQNVLSGSIQQYDAAVYVGGDQAATHRMNNVRCEILQIEKLLAFLLQLAALVQQRLRQQPGQVGNRQKPEQVAEEPNLQDLGSGFPDKGARNLSGVSQDGNTAQHQQTNPGDQECRASRKQDATYNDD